MKKIVYFGMAFLPNKNAVANRALTIAKLARNSGYEPILIGVNSDVSLGSYKHYYIDNIECFDVSYSISFIHKIVDSFKFDKCFKDILRIVGLKDITAVIMQDYQLMPMLRISRYLEKNNIQFIPDVMDWYVPTKDSNIYKNIFKTIDTWIRMYFFYPNLEKKICISYTFKDFFNNKKQKNTVIPCTCLDGDKTFKKNDNEKILFFAGNPGKKLQKEKLDWVIKALFEMKSNMKLYVFGVTLEEIVKSNEHIKKYITHNISFFGKRSRQECLKYLKESDFSIIVREKTKLSTYGFSSKICEAFAYCIPVLATNVGDNKRYIKNGYNGFICESNYEDLKALLSTVEHIDKEMIIDMKKNISTNNPLSCENYYNDFYELIKENN